jgi:hypothetical protein
MPGEIMYEFAAALVGIILGAVFAGGQFWNMVKAMHKRLDEVDRDLMEIREGLIAADIIKPRGRE